MKLINNEGQELELKSVQVVKVPKSAKIIVTVPFGVPDEIQAKIDGVFSALFPDNKVLVISEDIKYEVVDEAE
jgi:hypothetical protein